MRFIELCCPSWGFSRYLVVHNGTLEITVIDGCVRVKASKGEQSFVTWAEGVSIRQDLPPWAEPEHVEFPFTS